MNEKTRTSHAEVGPGGGTPSSDEDSHGLVTVSHGPYGERLPVSGMTVEAIRNRYQDRFDIDPNSLAFIDGNQVENNTALRSGQVLIFARRSGEKGIGATKANEHKAEERITIEGDSITSVSPEGAETRVELSHFLKSMMAPPRMDTCDIILPDGVKYITTMGNYSVWVHQTPPRVVNLKWIAEGSPKSYGPGTEYRSVKIALPYLVIFAVFRIGGSKGSLLVDYNECFFRNEPLKTVDDSLYYPALLNCSKFEDPDSRPLSWICTQHLVRNEIHKITHQGHRLRASLDALRSTLLDTGFNLSSDEHEGMSWFTQSRRVDDRIASIENWEKATQEDAMFVLQVPWIPVNKTVREITRRTFENLSAKEASFQTAGDMARLISRHALTPPPSNKKDHAS